MKQKTLHVENFGPVSDATIELRAINMFIGEQSIGKSTLAKLITIFTDYITLCTLIKFKEEFWTALLKDYDLDTYSVGSYHIEYDMAEEDDRFHIELRPGQISFYMKTGEQEIGDSGEINQRIFKLKVKKFHHTEKLLEAATLEKKEFLELFNNSLYIPAERIICSVLTNLMPALTLARSTVPQNLLRFMIDLNNAKSEYPLFQIPMLNIAFKHESSDDSIVIDSDKKDIPMRAASSGIQSLVPLLLVLRYATEKREYCSFVVEEPECNLFPTKQVELLKEIIKMVKDPTRTLTITTHSPYLLAAMNNLLFAGMLCEKYGPEIKRYIDEIIPEAYQLKAGDCSVYSLGKDINDGEYCKSLKDETTGMIDYNSLDGVSEELGDEFEALQRTVLEIKRSN